MKSLEIRAMPLPPYCVSPRDYYKGSYPGEKMHDREPKKQNSAMHENPTTLPSLLRSPPIFLLLYLPAASGDSLRDQRSPSSRSCQPCCPMSGTSRRLMSLPCSTLTGDEVARAVRSLSRSSCTLPVSCLSSLLPLPAARRPMRYRPPPLLLLQLMLRSVSALARSLLGTSPSHHPPSHPHHLLHHHLSRTLENLHSH
jgi:hypothetical protein